MESFNKFLVNCFLKKYKKRKEITKIHKYMRINNNSGKILLCKKMNQFKSILMAKTLKKKEYKNMKKIVCLMSR